ncbi:hypothetical protein MAIC_00060 [Mycolicibacterium aichiense]|uniref:Uncharacterized protein n=1 Tax=Mycolicibacterium aichiense TaxID=1799 RepID=A0AAD1HGZ1_9MYCO|nr:hypothetical protein MAIC_00060 [Mycolicibacterium aichiense]
MISMAVMSASNCFTKPGTCDIDPETKSNDDRIALTMRSVPRPVNRQRARDMRLQPAPQQPIESGGVVDMQMAEYDGADRGKRDPCLA